MHGLNSEYTRSILSIPVEFWVHPLNSEYTRSILSSPAQFWVHPLNSEYTRSILGTPAQFWLYPLNSEYTHSILSTPAQFWVHPLNSGYTRSILIIPTQFWVHPLNSEYTRSILSTRAQFWVQCSVLSTRAQFLLPLPHEKIRLSLIRWARRTCNLPSKSSPLFCKSRCQPLPNIFPLVFKFLRATTITSTNLNNQGILGHFLAKEQEFTLFQRVQTSKEPTQTLS